MKHRLVVDHRNVNKSVEIANKAYLLTIQSQLQKIPRGAILSSVDLVSAFWQFTIDNKTLQRLTIAMERGPFRPTCLPFSLVSSPSEMCAHMQKIMTGFPSEHLIQYMDYLVIFSTNMDKLIDLTGKLLNRLSEYRLKINPKKSNLFCIKARVRGHNVYPEGTCLLPKYIDKVQKVPTLKTPKELQSFPGLAAWCSKYCAYLVDIAKPLFAILKVSAKDFKWEPQHEKAFNHVKLLFTSSLCLAQYDDNAPLKLYMDSSEFAISAMLAIVQNDKRHLVTFWSRFINATEINYSIYNEEFLLCTAQSNNSVHFFCSGNFLRVVYL